MKRGSSQADDRLESIAGPSGTGHMALQTIATPGTYIRPCSYLVDLTSTSYPATTCNLPSAFPAKPPAFPLTHSHIHTTQIDMRTLSVRGMFGVSSSVKMSIPGKFSISFPTISRGGRAQSEPLYTNMESEDVEMGAPEPRRAHSEYFVRIPQEGTDQVNRRDTRSISKESVADRTESMIDEREDEEEMDGETEAEEYSQSVSQRPRAPSPAATEIDDPESQDVVMDIQTRGVKVRDFAFIRPDNPPSSPLSLPVTATTTDVPFTPAMEIFDQYKALAEVEYRWTQPHRNYPIPGRISRRLLDMKWLSQFEWNQRAYPMDIEDLRRHDARPRYPWKPFRATSIPSLEERRSMMSARAGMFNQLDRMRAHQENKEAVRAYEMAAAAAAAAQMEEDERLEREKAAAWSSSFTRNKRRLAALDDDPQAEVKTPLDSDVSPFLDSSRAGDAKKRRITPQSSSVLQPPQLTPFQPHPYSLPPALAPPAKQYPAPLHSYNPVFYPEAASIIESSSQSSSQPRPIVPERFDTPPLDEEETQAGGSPGKGNRLVHPRERKAMQRGLSRTQTFAQL